jgi:hypothetical protein
MRNEYKILVEKSLEDTHHKDEDSIKMDLIERRVRRCGLDYNGRIFGFLECCECADYLSKYKLYKERP